MNEVVLAGLGGMQAGRDAAVRDATRVVRSFSPDAQEDPIQPLVDLKRDQFQYQASAKVVQVGEEMWRSTLDIIA